MMKKQVNALFIQYFIIKAGSCCILFKQKRTTKAHFFLKDAAGALF